MHGVTCVYLKIGVFLICNVVGLAARNEHVLGSGFYTGIGAIVRGQLGACMLGLHRRVARAAHAVANLACPRLVRSGSD